MDLMDQETFGKLKELMKDSEQNGEVPSRKEMLEMLDMVDMKEEVRENLKAMLVGDVPQVFGANAGGALAVVFVLLVFSLIVFFGYKLYKSIKEKEKKREEKKRAKQLKKKK